MKKVLFSRVLVQLKMHFVSKERDYCLLDTGKGNISMNLK